MAKYGTEEYYKEELEKKDLTFRMAIIGFKCDESKLEYVTTEDLGKMIICLYDAYNEYVRYKEYANEQTGELDGNE